MTMIMINISIPPDPPLGRDNFRGDSEKAIFTLLKCINFDV